MEKINFLDYIERHYGFQLTSSQLKYYFTTNKYVVMTSPRKGGKTFIASLDALQTCTTPNKNVCIVIGSEIERRFIQNYIIDIVESLNGYITIDFINDNQIKFTNNSNIYFKSNEFDSRGTKFNKAIISEPDSINDMEDLILRLELCMAICPDAQIKLVGTHMRNKTNLISYMLNPYYEKIQITYNQLHYRHSEEDLRKIREIMDTVSYNLEILNNISPNVIGAMFQRSE
ncbi:MAG: hypothetical protein RR406_00195 [Bacilli bacterium]